MEERNSPALSVLQVGRRLRVSESTTRRLIETGELKAHRVRHLVRVFEADLQEYLARNANQQQRGAA
jgi:excisionase family DNA binding protein